jgi:transcriptional regulator with XRE-family HTH domain
MSKESADPVIIKARELFAASGKTMEEIGVAMGFPSATARKSVWQLLNKIDDPRLSTLRNFAAALGVSMSEFFPAEKKSRPK